MGTMFRRLEGHCNSVCTMYLAMPMVRVVLLTADNYYVLAFILYLCLGKVKCCWALFIRSNVLLIDLFFYKKQPENVDVPTVSTPMTTTVQQQVPQETLPPTTGAGTVQGIAIFYALPVVEYHVEMKWNNWGITIFINS